MKKLIITTITLLLIGAIFSSCGCAPQVERTIRVLSPYQWISEEPYLYLNIGSNVQSTFAFMEWEGEIIPIHITIDFNGDLMFECFNTLQEKSEHQDPFIMFSWTLRDEVLTLTCNDTGDRWRLVRTDEVKSPPS